MYTFMNFIEIFLDLGETIQQYFSDINIQILTSNAHGWLATCLFIYVFYWSCIMLWLLCSSDSKESTYSAGDLGSLPGSERSPGEGNGNPLQCSCLESSMDRGALVGCRSRGHKELDTTERLTLHVMLGKSILREKRYMIMLDEIFSNLSSLVLKMKTETCGLFLYLITFLCVDDLISFTWEQFKQLKQLFNNPQKSLHYQFRF